jgi:Bacterial mobilisation protein (MobC)
MRRDHYVKTRVPEHTKQRVQEMASQRFLTESIWLRQIIEAEIQKAAATLPSAPAPPPERGPTGRRISVRLLPGDALLLKERATARRTVPATYVSILLRAHLRELSPLTKDELQAFREQVRELRAIGRNLNQIARALNRGEVVDASVREDLWMFVKLGTAMREATRALLKANTKAWEVGHVPE